MYTYIVSGREMMVCVARPDTVQLQINNRYFSLVIENCHYRERSDEEESSSLSRLYVIRR